MTDSSGWPIKAPKLASMERFKRNQIEEAIAAVLRPKNGALPPDLRIRVKRLLDTDRTLGQDADRGKPEAASFAFYSAVPPGSGTEVWFSGYEAFALLVGLRLQGNGWPQRAVVRILRQVRQELERDYHRTLAQDPAQLSDPEELRRRAYPGALADKVTDPVYLAIVTPERPNGKSADESMPRMCGICRGRRALSDFIRKNAPPGMLTIVLEVAASVHALRHFLLQTKPRKRGRRA